MAVPQAPGALLIRADSGARIGVGHVMRCLSLAQAWQARGGTVTLASATPNPVLEPRLHQEGLRTAMLDCEIASAADAAATVACARRFDACWIILDGYQFDTEYQSQVRNGGCPVLQLDDYVQSPRFAVTALLNQNLHADPAAYASAAPEVLLLLGNRYTLLRREFWPWRGRLRTHGGRVGRILVTLGGGDADNVTGRVIEGLLPLLRDLDEVVVVAGANNPHWDALKALGSRASASLRLERNVTDMTALLSGTDLAICGGGATCWEMAFFGIPFLPVVLAENQRMIAESLDRAGVAVNLGWYDRLSPERIEDEVRTLLDAPGQLRSISERGQQLVDGWGCERVLDALLAHTDKNQWRWGEAPLISDPRPCG